MDARFKELISLNDRVIIFYNFDYELEILRNVGKELSIENGDKLVAYTFGDTIMLKVLKVPTNEEFLKMMDNAQEWAKSVGYKEEDVDGTIKEVRQKTLNENNH